MSAPIYMKDSLRIKHCKRNSYLYNINDTVIGTSLDNYGEYAEKEIALASQLLREGDVVIDVGAGIGTHSVEFSKMVGDTGLVVSLEPSTVNYSFLVSNLTMNNCFNTHHYKAAISGNGQHGYIRANAVHEEMDHSALKLSNDEFTSAESEYSAVFTLDEMMLERCDFVKINAPGNNYNVLLTGERMLTTARPFVLIGCDDSTEEIIRFLTSANYHCYCVPTILYSKDNYYNNPKNAFKGIKPQSKIFAHRAEADVSISGYKKVN